MWYCETCKKDISTTTKSSHIKTTTQIEKATNSRKTITAPKKTYTYLRPGADHVDG